MIELINKIMPGANEYLSEAYQFCYEWYSRGTDLWILVPSVVRSIVHFVLIVAYYLAVLGTITSLVKAILKNYKEWKPIPDSKLMFSYFCGSGDYQRVLIYKDAKKLVCDKTWPWISAAGLAFRLGNLSHSSKIVMFLLTFVYLPIATIGAVELVFRFFIGHVTYAALNICIAILYLAIRLVIYLVMPLMRMFDGAMRTEQHCPHCYNTFNLPYFRCPYCGEIHEQLIPAKSGLFFARCVCHHFLPSSVISQRNKLTAVCPKCKEDLAAANAKQFSIQVIGGNSSGKTAFIAAFEHLYRNNIDMSECVVRCEPEKAFEDVDIMFTNGYTEPSSPSEVTTYTLVHQIDGTMDQSLVFYDIPDELLLNEEYERNPLNFGYSDGIVVIVDPLSVASVRKECEKNNPDAIRGASEDDPESIVIHFISKFSEIAGRSARKMSNVPVAVLISKSDIKCIKSKIGFPKIKSIFNANPDLYQGNLEVAIDEVCREYLVDIGLGNILNNLDAVFSMVRCFPISAIGHTSNQGVPFEPFGVVEPIAWIGEKGRAGVSAQLCAVSECVSNDDFQKRMTDNNLADRYEKAIKLYDAGRLEAATKAFNDLSGYKDASDWVERIKETRYQSAIKKQSKENYEDAIKEFRSLGSYKDAQKQIIILQYAKVDFLISINKYKEALDYLKTMDKSDTQEEKMKEVRYKYAIHLIETHDYIGANAWLTRLGSYRDSKEKADSISFDRMRQEVKTGANRKIKFGKNVWRVLTVKDDLAMLITENTIGAMAYALETSYTSWSQSSVRRYLNSTFLNNFTDAEKAFIQAVQVKTPVNPDYNTPGGEDTFDSVFLLDISEAKQYFKDDSDRMPDTTAPGVYTEWCWLRSTGGGMDYAAIIDKTGVIRTGGNRVTNENGGLRPALFLKL